MILTLENLNKSYGTGNFQRAILKDISFSMDSEEFVCITGRSGSGKSTLLSICAGMLPPSSGHVLFYGEDLYLKSDGALSRLRNQQVGFIMQEYSVFANLTVRQNILLPAYIYEKRDDAEAYAAELMRMVEIYALADAYPTSLSGGEIRRISIARALINRPQIIYADEPTNDLDNLTTKKVMTLLKDIQRRGVSILMASHDSQAIRYADTIFELEAGTLKETKL